ncbi:hypothetical protein T492DRAFT_965285, partial [Pavlovales sp. CCMP2436]
RDICVWAGQALAGDGKDHTPPSPTKVARSRTLSLFRQRSVQDPSVQITRSANSVAFDSAVGTTGEQASPATDFPELSPLKERKANYSNASSARLFALGIGQHVNVHFLKTLAAIGRGSAEIALAESEVADRLGAILYAASSQVDALTHLAWLHSDIQLRDRAVALSLQFGLPCAHVRLVALETSKGAKKLAAEEQAQLREETQRAAIAATRRPSRRSSRVTLDENSRRPSQDGASPPLPRRRSSGGNSAHLARQQEAHSRLAAAQRLALGGVMAVGASAVLFGSLAATASNGREDAVSAGPALPLPHGIGPGGTPANGLASSGAAVAVDGLGNPSDTLRAIGEVFALKKSMCPVGIFLLPRTHRT